MKYPIVYGFTLVCLVLIASCTKDIKENAVSQPQPNQFINANISSGQTYVFTAGPTGLLSVNQRPSHSQISEVGTDDNGAVIYKYNSQPGYIGADETILSYTANSPSSANNSGCPLNHNQPAASDVVIDIKFNVGK